MSFEIYSLKEINPSDLIESLLSNILDDDVMLNENNKFNYLIATRFLMIKENIQIFKYSIIFYFNPLMIK